MAELNSVWFYKVNSQSLCQIGGKKGKQRKAYWKEYHQISDIQSAWKRITVWSCISNFVSLAIIILNCKSQEIMMVFLRDPSVQAIKKKNTK